MRLYPGVSIVTLGVSNVDRSSRFYERLGWRRSAGASNAAISFFALNTIVLALFARDALAEDCGLDPLRDDLRDDSAAGAFSGVTLAQNYGSEAAVVQAYEAVLAAGGQPRVAPAPTAWGGFHAIFADPDGHIWELAHNPFFELAADGTLGLPP